VLALAKQQGIKVSGLLTDLPQRYTASNRLQDFPLAKSRAILEGLQSDPLAYQSLWGDSLGNIIKRDLTDGLRLSFANGEIIHLRPSGNAPELRCYAEAGNMSRAEELVALSLHGISRS
jgi:phosphomannomutase